MKYIYTLFLLLFSLSASSQGAAYTVLNKNNAAAWITDVGILFNNPGQQLPGYDIGQGQNQHILYSSSFWFGGLNTNGDIYMCAQRYLTDGLDQYAGPFSSTNDYNTADYEQAYFSSIWVVDADTIHHHINHYMDPNYNMPYAIADWPAHGDTTLGVAYNLAPYIDVNNNGKYDPENGDYPDIKGCRAAYIITNDDAGPHNASYGMKMGIEMHYMIYQKSEQSDLPLTTFVDLKVFNRSNVIIKDFTIGYYADGDLGNPYDDYAGCDTNRNLMYYYNADNFDDDAQGNQGFHDDPPAFGIVCLNDTMNSFGQFINGGPSHQADPSIYDEYWYIMNSRWRNSAHWTDENGDLTDFLYHDPPTLAGGYSGYAMQNTPNDIRTIMSVKANDLAPDTSITRTYAVIPAYGSDHIDAVTELFTRVDNLQADFLNGNYDECDLALSVQEEIKSLETINIYPNPSHGSIQIQGKEKETYTIQIRDAIGQLVFETSNIKHSQSIKLPSSLKSGLYHLHVSTSERVYKTQPLIIQ